MSRLKRWFYRLTGGRPMIRQGYAFTDTVSGRPVYDYVDRLGRWWLAEGRWDRFRVARKLHPPVGWWKNYTGPSEPLPTEPQALIDTMQRTWDAVTDGYAVPSHMLRTEMGQLTHPVVPVQPRGEP